MSDDWHGQVYKHFESDLGMSIEDWRLLRYEVIKRDKRRCLRCDKRFKIKDLTAHHMMPREEGGSNDMMNLVTLCSPCHDFVEINGLKSRADISGSYDEDRPAKNPIIEVLPASDWHEWVYGGKRNPMSV